MKLVGLSFYKEAPGTLDVGFAALDSLNVLLGPNDAGKSQLLDYLAGALALQNLSSEELNRPDRRRFHEMALFVEAETDEEADLLVWLAIADLRWRAAGEPGLPRDESIDFGIDWLQPTIGRLPPEVRRADLGVWPEGALDAVPVPEGAGHRELWAQVLGATLPEQTDGWITLLDALRSSRTFALSPATDSPPQDNQPGVNWSVFWCLPPLRRLDETLERAVLGSGLVHFSESEEEAGTYGEFTFPEAPTVIAPVGATRNPLLPSPIVVPGDFELVAREVEAEIHEVTDELHLLLHPDVEIGNWSSDDDHWAIPEGDGFRPHPAVIQACEVLGDTATNALPSFISDRYRVLVTLKPLIEWGRGRRVELALLDDPPKERSRPMSLHRIADGHVLWVQLALLEAVDELRRFRERHLIYWSALDLDALGEVDPHGPPPDDEGMLWSYWANLTEFWQAGLLSGRVQESTLTPAAFAEEKREVAPGIISPAFADLLRIMRRRLYVMDEPERHLHPRAQREAARWLAGVIGRGRSQAVAASHSVSFLSLSENVALTHVWRAPGGPTHVEELGQGQLSAMSMVAAELGLDRGELLAAFEMFLFVEGAADRAVLEELKGEDLRRAGVCVVPLRGESRAPGVLDASLLMRFTDAKLAVWLDNVDERFVARLRDDYDFARQVKLDGHRSTEERRVADLILESRERGEHGRDLLVIPHPGTDVFDLLANEVIKARFPRWPGHEIARRSASLAREESGVRWKAYYESAYGVDVSEASCRQIARGMADAGQSPPALNDLVQLCMAAVLGPA
jgi:hypothetical protein